MDISTFASLALATLVFVLSPGPANLAVLVTSARDGFRSGFFLAIGEVIGALFYLVIALFSLSALAHVLGPVMTYIKLGGALYLMYLGYKQFIHKTVVMNNLDHKRTPIKQIMVGFLINGTNPKLVVFYLSFLPLFVELENLTPLISTQIVLTVGLTLLSGISLVCLMGQQLKKLMVHTKNAQRINRISGLVMIGVGVSIARS